MEKNKIILSLLVFLTLFAFLAGQLELVKTLFIALLLATTFMKGCLIIEYFMNLSEVQVKYRIIPTVWLSVVITLIAVAYYL